LEPFRRAIRRRIRRSLLKLTNRPMNHQAHRPQTASGNLVVDRTAALSSLCYRIPAFSDDLVQVTVLVNQSDYFPNVGAAFSAVGTSLIDDAVRSLNGHACGRSNVECSDGSHRQINNAPSVLGETWTQTAWSKPRDLCRDSYANWLYLNDLMGVYG